jgi:hypothetical protein
MMKSMRSGGAVDDEELGSDGIDIVVVVVVGIAEAAGGGETNGEAIEDDSTPLPRAVNLSCTSCSWRPCIATLSAMASR